MTKQPPRCIIILGFMCAGKTSVAHALARQSNLQMLDLDEAIIEQEQRSIANVIEEDGVERFREIETYALQHVLGKGAANIIALGGGAWTIEQNRSLLAQHDCLTVWLDTPFELCWNRIVNAEIIRPLATDRESAHRLYRERRPLYALAAQRIRVTEERSADELASEIINLCKSNTT
jgi:shikimate kinase